jgi:hypothetical protein
VFWGAKSQTMKKMDGQLLYLGEKPPMDVLQQLLGVVLTPLINSFDFLVSVSTKNAKFILGLS